jgi:prefoldin beta subunit
MVELSQQAQQLLVQLDQQQRNLQTIMLQLENLTVQRIGTEQALEELNKAGADEEVFKLVGPILIKSTKKGLVEELQEKKARLDSAITRTKKQEEIIKKRLEVTQQKLRESLGKPAQG